MIAALHYYNSYNTFIDKEKNRERRISPYKTKEYKNTELTYFLNKSLNDNIKSYMFELSTNFNGLKNIANNIYEKISYNFPMETLEENFKSFASTYNRFIGFLQENSENGMNFKSMLKSTKKIINDNEAVLNELGISISEDGFLSMDKENDSIFSVNTDEIKDFYSTVYDKMCNFMAEPMSNHMNFKDFSYYFNYSGDYDKNKSFKIIEQGLLVDIKL